MDFMIIEHERGSITYLFFPRIKESIDFEIKKRG